MADNGRNTKKGEKKISSPRGLKKKLKTSASHETTDTGKLNFTEAWVQEKLGVEPGDDVQHYDIPGTKAVILIKPDFVNGLPDRIKQVLKSDEELAKDLQEYKAAIMQEAMDTIEARSLGLDGDLDDDDEDGDDK